MFWTLDCSTDAMRQHLNSESIADGLIGAKQDLSALFESHYSSSIRVARRILGSDEETFDVVQSAYLAAFQHLGSFRGDAQFRRGSHAS